MSCIQDKESVLQAYFDVRNDSTETDWLILKYDGKSVVVHDTGTGFENFKEHFTDDDRVFGYLRITTGDEMSRRQKFVLITWAGCNVSPVKKARLSTDKSSVKEVIQTYATELFLEEHSELTEEFIRAQVKKAGGANYGDGTGSGA